MSTPISVLPCELRCLMILCKSCAASILFVDSTECNRLHLLEFASLFSKALSMADEHALELLLSRLEDPFAKLATNDATDYGANYAAYLAVNVSASRYAYCDPCGSTNYCTYSSSCV